MISEGDYVQLGQDWLVQEIQKTKEEVAEWPDQFKHKKQEYTLSVCFNVSDEPLMIKKSKPDWQAGKWNLPGGHIEPTDTSPVAAALRELKEETGLVEPANPYYPSYVAGTIEGKDHKIYVVRHVDIRGSMKDFTDVGDPIKWCKHIDINKEHCIPNLCIILPLVLGRLRGWRLFGEKNSTRWEIEI